MIRNTLSNKIEKVQSKIVDEKTRNYIGASGIGADCLRQIWYEFKGTKSDKIESKVKRTWKIGKILEESIREWLLDSGIIISTNYPELVHPNMPFFKGNVDGVWIENIDNPIPLAIVEIKTAKDSSFNIFIKKGLKDWVFQYYAQIQCYMGLSGIRKAYIIVLNKDNSDISDELIDFDPEIYKELENKALMISKAITTPPRINQSPIWYQCKICKFQKLCHNLK